MENKMLPGELWLFGNSLVFIPPEGIEMGLTIGMKPVWFPGEVEIDTEIKLGGKYMKWQSLPLGRKSSRAPGFGWEYFGFENLDKKLPEKVKIWMLKLVFGDSPG
jgi:hypothetical protein